MGHSLLSIYNRYILSFVVVVLISLLTLPVATLSFVSPTSAQDFSPPGGRINEQDATCPEPEETNASEPSAFLNWLLPSVHAAETNPNCGTWKVTLQKRIPKYDAQGFFTGWDHDPVPGGAKVTIQRTDKSEAPITKSAAIPTVTFNGLKTGKEYRIVEWKPVKCDLLPTGYKAKSPSTTDPVGQDPKVTILATGVTKTDTAGKDAFYTLIADNKVKPAGFTPSTINNYNKEYERNRNRVLVAPPRPSVFKYNTYAPTDLSNVVNAKGLLLYPNEDLRFVELALARYNPPIPANIQRRVIEQLDAHGFFTAFTVGQKSYVLEQVRDKKDNKPYTIYFDFVQEVEEGANWPSVRSVKNTLRHVLPQIVNFDKGVDYMYPPLDYAFTWSAILYHKYSGGRFNDKAVIYQHDPELITFIHNYLLPESSEINIKRRTWTATEKTRIGDYFFKIGQRIHVGDYITDNTGKTALEVVTLVSGARLAITVGRGGYLALKSGPELIRLARLATSREARNNNRQFANFLRQNPNAGQQFRSAQREAARIRQSVDSAKVESAVARQQAQNAGRQADNARMRAAQLRAANAPSRQIQTAEVNAARLAEQQRLALQRVDDLTERVNQELARLVDIDDQVAAINRSANAAGNLTSGIEAELAQLLNSSTQLNTQLIAARNHLNALRQGGNINPREIVRLETQVNRYTATLKAIQKRQQQLIQRLEGQPPQAGPALTPEVNAISPSSPIAAQPGAAIPAKTAPECRLLPLADNVAAQYTTEQLAAVDRLANILARVAKGELKSAEESHFYGRWFQDFFREGVRMGHYQERYISGKPINDYLTLVEQRLGLNVRGDEWIDFQRSVQDAMGAPFVSRWPHRSYNDYLAMDSRSLAQQVRDAELAITNPLPPLSGTTFSSAETLTLRTATPQVQNAVRIGESEPAAVVVGKWFREFYEHNPGKWESPDQALYVFREALQREISQVNGTPFRFDSKYINAINKEVSADFGQKVHASPISDDEVDTIVKRVVSNARDTSSSAGETSGTQPVTQPRTLPSTAGPGTFRDQFTAAQHTEIRELSERFYSIVHKSGLTLEEASPEVRWLAEAFAKYYNDKPFLWATPDEAFESFVAVVESRLGFMAATEESGAATFLGKDLTNEYLFADPAIKETFRKAAEKAVKRQITPSSRASITDWQLEVQEIKRQAREINPSLLDKFLDRLNIGNQAS